MISLGLTVPVGIAILMVLYLVFYRWTPLNAKQSGLIIGLLSLAIYFPIILIEWPGADVVALNVTVFFMTAYMLAMFFSHRERVRLQSLSDGSKLKWFHWGPAVIVIFFVVILIINSVFVTLSREGLPEGLESMLITKQSDSGAANTRFPGVMFNHYQKKEAYYNRYLAQQERMRELGWQVRKGWLGAAPKVGEQGVFQVAVMDAQGNNVSDLNIKGRFVRASDSRKDMSFVMTENSGLHQLRISIPEPGLWHVNINILQGDELFELFASTSVDAK